MPPADEAIAAEVADLRAVMVALGEDVAVYGHSSGACLTVRAAAGGAPMPRMVLHEPPWSDDDAEASRSRSRSIRAAVEEGRLGDAITVFMADMGLPAAILENIAADPAMLAVAPTMPYDLAATGDDGSLPRTALSEISVPTLVLAGTSSPPFFLRTAEQVTALVPGAGLTVLEGADHGAPADVVAPAVLEFLVR